jgi:hypothetical protein
MTKHWLILGSALAMAGAGVGCGKENDSATAQSGYHDANVAEQASVRASESKPETVPAVSGSGLSAGEMRAEPVTGSVPETKPSSGAPDLLAKVSKELVTRGETVDITAEGSPDVTEMLLSDGYGTTQTLMFDAESNTWKTAYRVPLNMKLERLGLSIRAKNGDNRWRRVWVFVSLPENSAKADSVTQ